MTKKVKMIPLRDRKGEVRNYTMVDSNDFEWLSKWRWSISRSKHLFYVARKCTTNGVEKEIKIHRLITKCPKGKVVDHINGNPLDNRRANLRVCTQKENVQNRTKLNSNSTSGYRGVTWLKNDKKWASQIMIDGKHKSLGRFATAIEASAAREKFQRELNSQKKKR